MLCVVVHLFGRVDQVDQVIAIAVFFPQQLLVVTQEISPGKFVDLDPIFQLLEVILNGSVL
jgi:hypothetical protein